MLSRVLEPELMDTPAEAIDYDAMDHRAVNRSFADDFLATAEAAGVLPASWRDEPSDEQYEAADFFVDVLDLGTGPARIPIEICRSCPRARIVATDLAVEMLDLARAIVEIASLTDRIRLDRADAKQLPYPNDSFRAVVSNSIVHHIPEPRQALAEAVRVAAPGGLIFFRDLLRPADDATVRHLVQQYAGEANDHGRAMFDASLRAALSLDEIRALVAEMNFSPDSVQATSDRHWTWTGVKAVNF